MLEVLGLSGLLPPLVTPCFHPELPKVRLFWTLDGMITLGKALGEFYPDIVDCIISLYF